MTRFGSYWAMAQRRYDMGRNTLWGYNEGEDEEDESAYDRHGWGFDSMDCWEEEEDEEDEDNEDEDDEDEDEEDEGESEVDEAQQDFKTQLKTCLDGIQNDGSPWSLRTYQDYTNPSLQIDGCGLIRLPLSERDAAAISKQAVPTAVGMWALGASKVKCRNPAWTAYLDKVAGKSVGDLGVQVKAYLEARGLILYAKGASVGAETQKWQEERPRVFGTLLVCLASEHEGGAVHIVQGKQHDTLETSSTSAFDLSTLAWYSDVHPEFRPLASGYRLALVYDLMCNEEGTKNKPEAAEFERRGAQMERLLTLWRDEHQDMPPLIYPLFNEYDKGKISLQTPRGPDLERCKFLERRCASNGVVWLIGTLKRRKRYIGSEDSRQKISLSGSLFTFSGSNWHINLGRVSERDILVDFDDFYCRDPDSTNQVSRFYSRHVCSYWTDKFTKMSHHETGQLSEFFHFLQDDQARYPDANLPEFVGDAMKKIMSIACDQIMATPFNPVKQGPSESISHMVIRYLAEKNRSHLAREALLEITQKPSWLFSEGRVRIVATHIAVTQKNRSDNKVWLDRFSSSLPKARTFTQIVDTIKSFDEFKLHLVDTYQDMCDRWKMAKVESALKRTNSFSKDASPALLLILPKVGMARYSKFILPVLVASADKMALLKYLIELYKATETAAHPSIVKPIYAAILKADPPIIQLTIDDICPNSSQPNKIVHPARVSSKPTPDKKVQHVERYFSFLTVFYRTLNLGLIEESKRLISANFPPLSVIESELGTNWIELVNFIIKLVRFFKHCKDARVYTVFRTLAVPVVYKLAEYQITNRPHKPRNWARLRVKPCAGGCPHCSKLNRFLLDPNQEDAHFAYPTTIRDRHRGKLSEDDYKTKIVNTDKGPNLVVYKTNNAYSRADKAWRARQSLLKELSGYLGRIELSEAAEDAAFVDRLIRAVESEERDAMRCVQLPEFGDVGAEVSSSATDLPIVNDAANVPMVGT
ncbi:hypothetical protein CC80DRAFT_531084 [Byssothecium circinans]|uniref:Uncharacterized protein n=1 Tax=Byssothecium circinans TaxID=147558 RepID=A0A6A5UGP8_9PLEO|nr:hypothetical protein CC80DRAFT_531084 [Byssothecium circinans]